VVFDNEYASHRTGAILAAPTTPINETERRLVRRSIIRLNWRSNGGGLGCRCALAASTPPQEVVGKTTARTVRAPCRSRRVGSPPVDKV